MHSRRGPPTAALELLFNDVFLHHQDLILLVELILGHLLYNHPIEGPSHQCQRPRCGFVRIARCIGRSRAGGRARSQGHDTAAGPVLSLALALTLTSQILNPEFICRPVLLKTASSRQSRVDQLDRNRLAAGAQPSTIDDRAAGELAKMLFAASSGMTRGGQI